MLNFHILHKDKSREVGKTFIFFILPVFGNEL